MIIDNFSSDIVPLSLPDTSIKQPTPVNTDALITLGRKSICLRY